MQAAEQYAKAQDIGQEDMFGVLAEEPEQVEHAYAAVPELPEQVLLDGEREALGLYLTGHPVTQYLKELNRYAGGLRISEASPTGWGKMITLAGIVVDARVRITKKGNRIGLFTLDDRSGRMDAMLFTDSLEKFEHLLVKDKILIVTGQVSNDDFNGGLKMSVREIVDLKDARAKYVKGLAITLTENEANRTMLQRLQQIFEPYRQGSILVNLYYHRDDSVVRLQFGTTWRIVPEDALIIELKTLLGNDRVEFEFE